MGAWLMWGGSSVLGAGHDAVVGEEGEGLRRAAGAIVEPVRWLRRLGSALLVTRRAVRSRGEIVITVEDNSDTLDFASDRLQ